MISFDRLEANLSNILATVFLPLAVDGMPPTLCLSEKQIEGPNSPKTPSEHPSLLTNTCFHFPAPVCTSTPIPCTPGKSLNLSQKQRTFRARRRYCDSLTSGAGHLSVLKRKRHRTPPSVRVLLSPAQNKGRCRLISYTDKRGYSPSLRRQRASCRLTTHPGFEGCSFRAETHHSQKAEQPEHVTFQVEQSTSSQAPHSCTLKIEDENTLTTSNIPRPSGGGGGSSDSCCGLFVPVMSSKIFASVAYVLILLAKKTFVPHKYQQFFTILQEQFWHDLSG